MLEIEIIRFEAQDIVTASCICNGCVIHPSGKVFHAGCSNKCTALVHNLTLNEDLSQEE